MKRAFRHLSQSRLLKAVAKLALTLGAFWWVTHDLDIETVGAMLRGQDHSLLLAAVLLIAAQIVLGGLRWRLILLALARQGRRLMSVAEALRLYYISVFFNTCLPGTVGGDVVRVWLARSDHVPLPLSINSVIIDRLIALIALVLIVAFTLPWLGDLLGFDALPVLLAAAAVAAIGLWLLRRIKHALERREESRLVKWPLFFLNCLRLMLDHPGASVLSLGYALVAHACFCGAAMVLARSLGAELGLMQALTLIPPVLLAITLPVSIGGWGVREMGMVGMLALAGVPQAVALMLSVQLGLIVIVLSLPGGAMWLARRGRQQAAHG